MRSSTLVLALSLIPSLAFAQAVPIVPEAIPPVIGHVDTDHALLWLRAPGQYSVQVKVGDDAAGKLPIQRLGRGFGNVRLDGLSPATAYSVEATVGGVAPVKLAFTTAPRPGPYGNVRFGVGSCARVPKQPVWDQVPKTQLDLFLWLGDNTYYWKRKGGGADWDNVAWMVEKQLKNRTLPNVLAAMRGMACYGVWDDHDYGPNNSDHRWALRAEARLVHRYLWANPGYGQNERGVYFSFRRGPVEFFMLDGRTFKDVRKGIPQAERTLYGAEQLTWLRRGIEASDAPLKVVAGGVQQLLGYPQPAESWMQAPAERRGFLDWLAQEGSRVLFLSGDIHVSELYQADIGGGKTAWELTSSGLANGSRFSGLFKVMKRPERKWIVAEENFCVVDVDVPPEGEASVRFRCVAAKDGKVLAETTAPLSSFGGSE